MKGSKIMENPQNFRLAKIKAKLEESPELILKHFNVDYVNKGSYLQGLCPCHAGDNQNSFSVRLEGYHNWACYTKLCQEDHGSDLIGLVSGILSYRKGKSVVFPYVLDYCEEKIGIADSAPVDCDFNRLCINLNKTIETPKILGDRRILSELNIPSPYFLNRGYSADTLKKFCIGDCLNPQKPMFNRAVCPIFQEDGVHIIGAAGRTISEKSYLQKWKYSYGFKSGSNLYGLWLALPEIQRTSRIILVEGMMDVAKLHEMCYTNTCGLFGVNITGNQIEILNRLGVMNVDFLLDGDEAGELAGKRNYEKCKDYFNVRVLVCPKSKDPDELTKDELELIFKN